MAYNSRQSNSRQSNMFRSSQHPNTKTPGSVVKKKQQKQTTEDDLILSETDIVQCLTELKIVFTAEDLRTPMPTKVQYLFETFVLEMMGLRREVVEPIAQVLSEDQQYPEVHYDSLVFLVFYRSLVQLMESAGISDFTFDDITKPTTERLRLILSSVINMFRFKSERMPVIEGYLEKSDSIAETVEKLCIENEDLARRVEELTAQRKREEPAIKGALEENRKLAEELRGLKQKETLRTMESDKVKQERSSHISALKNFRYLVETNQRECQKLQPYIVDSPEKLQQVIGDLGKTLQKEREAVDSAERQARALKISADSFSIVEADVASCIRLMEDCEKEMIKRDEIVRKVQRQQEVLQEKDTEAKELTRKEERVSRTLKNAEEKLIRAREQAASRQASAKRELERLKEEYTQLADERAATNREINAKHMKIDSLEKEMAGLREQLEEETHLAQVEYDKLSSHIHLYISKLEQQMP